MEEKESQKADRFNFKFITLLVLIFIMLGVFVLLQCKNSFLNLPERTRVVEGLPAPNFSLPGLDGKIVSLTDYKGKVVLLNIWATWCPPCVEEMPSMEKLYKELKGENFEILAVSIDASGARDVAPFMKKHKLSFPALLNPKGTIKGLYGAVGIPESFIINKEGIVEKKIIGARDWAAPEAIRFFRYLIQKPWPTK